jgi:hypothetical protein
MLFINMWRYIHVSISAIFTAPEKKAYELPLYVAPSRATFKIIFVLKNEAEKIELPPFSDLITGPLTYWYNNLFQMLSLHTYIHLCNCEPQRFYDSFVVFLQMKKVFTIVHYVHIVFFVYRILFNLTI